jgi:hypothetical protein
MKCRLCRQSLRAINTAELDCQKKQWHVHELDGFVADGYFDQSGTKWGFGFPPVLRPLQRGPYPFPAGSRLNVSNNAARRRAT